MTIRSWNLTIRLTSRTRNSSNKEMRPRKGTNPFELSDSRADRWDTRKSLLFRTKSGPKWGPSMTSRRLQWENSDSKITRMQTFRPRRSKWIQSMGKTPTRVSLTKRCRRRRSHGRMDQTRMRMLVIIRKCLKGEIRENKFKSKAVWWKEKRILHK